MEKLTWSRARKSGSKIFQFSIFSDFLLEKLYWSIFAEITINPTV